MIHALTSVPFASQRQFQNAKVNPPRFGHAPPRPWNAPPRPHTWKDTLAYYGEAFIAVWAAPLAVGLFMLALGLPIINAATKQADQPTQQTPSVAEKPLDATG